MDRQFKIRLICVMAIAIPFGVSAQTVAPIPPIQQPVAPTIDISDDVVSVPPNQIGIALRHAGIEPSSLTVTYDGRSLSEGTDYTLDSAAGVIYLKIPVIAGHTIEAHYRYSQALASGVSTGTSINQIAMNLLPGSLGLNMGFGLVQRNADGTIQRSNMIGLNNKFGTGIGTLSGTFMYGSSTTQSGFENFDQGTVGGAGVKLGMDGSKQTFIDENLSNKFMGGSLIFNYQDISSQFNNFAGIGGMTPAQIQQLETQKGMKESGVQIQGAKIGGLSLAGSDHTLTDGHGAITQDAVSLKNKTFHASYSSQQVGHGFTRFDALPLANQVNMRTQVGLDKTAFDTGVTIGKGSSLGFNEQTISDGKGIITREQGTLATPSVAIDFGTQKVDSQFSSGNSLLLTDKNLYLNQIGIRQEWLNLQTPANKAGNSLKVNGVRLASDKGSYTQFQSQFATKLFTITRTDDDMTKGFAQLNGINPVQSLANINSINQMYGPGVPLNAPAEMGLYQTGLGISRDFTGISLTPAKGTSFNAGLMQMSDATGSGQLSHFQFTDPKMTLNYRNDNVGAKFSDLPKLMNFEKGQWGQIPGLNQSNVGLNLILGKNESLSASSLNANSPQGGASRYNFGLITNSLQASLVSHSVDPKFSQVNLIPDPEAGLFQSLLGQSQSIANLHWTASKTLQLTANSQDASNLTSHTSTNQNNVALNYSSKGTAVGMTLQSTNNSNPAAPYLSHTDQVVTVSRQTGNWIFNLSQQSDNYSQTQADLSLAKPISYSQQSAGITVKLTKNTSLSTVQSKTSLENGQTQASSTNSVTTQLSPRAGITLSESQVNTIDPTQHTETHRNYGFWYDLGKGMQLRYGYIRQFDSSGPGTLNSVLSLGNTTVDPNIAQVNAINQGSIGSWAIGGGYGVNQWQDVAGMTTNSLTRTQAFSNLRLNTIKPINLGIMKQANFHVSVDSAADNFNWIRQDNNYGGSWSMEGLTWGLDYHSQLDPSSNLAIDRAISVSTNLKKRTLVSGSIAYKMRTLAKNQHYMIRSYQVNFNPSKRLTISNQFTTNPEIPNPMVLLGSIPQPLSQDVWNLNYTKTKNTDIGGSWEEIANSQAHTSSVTAGLHATLFKTSSPLTLFYGLEDAMVANTHQLVQRWSVGYQQKSGPHQNFDFFVGDLDYQYSIPNGQLSHNLSFRLDYTFHF